MSDIAKPSWLKVKAPGGDNFTHIKHLLRSQNLHTVCEEARCPNIGECWNGGTATFMLMGDTCTRACRFCHVKTGNPKQVLDSLEPQKIAKSVCELSLTYVVLTSVNRDDLEDGGASHFGKTVSIIRQKNPKILIETLIPDFLGDKKALDSLIESAPTVIAHNLETVKRLTEKVRDKRATYQQSLSVLKYVKEKASHIYTKSSLMLGLSETKDEVLKAMDDLRSIGVDILTLGQYLRPTQWHLPVIEYIHPTVFEHYKELALEKGFLFVASGPLVRGSYRAGELFIENNPRNL